MRNFLRFVPIVVTATLAAQGGLPPALQRMADTERAFAKRAAETTIREAFIEYFADEAVGFQPDPTPARQALRKQTTSQPAGVQLLWEPRYGDVARSGDLGYLTGPFENRAPGQPPRYGNYFSVWKRQPGGEYRVVIDLGGPTPEPPVYAPGLTRATATATWTGTELPAASAASLTAADKALSAAIAAKGAGAAYGSVMPQDVVFFRTGFPLMRTREAALEWLRARVKAWTTGDAMKTETAASGDLGYTWGKYNLTPLERAAYSGYYVRVWTRKADGAWQLVAETVTPPPPPNPPGR